MSKGVLILALGNPLYARYAYNLAVSIKANSDIPIALVYTKEALAEYQTKHFTVFEKLILAPEEVYTLNGEKQYQMAKCYLDKLTPWDRTLYLDADSLWCPNHDVQNIFANGFAIGTQGGYDISTSTITGGYMFWGDPKQIANYYCNDGYLPKTFSAIMYFEKEKSAKIFNAAAEVYRDKDTPCKEWNGGKPDEYCFNVSLMLNNIKQEDWCPQYFVHFHGHLTHHQMKKNFSSIAMSGHETHRYLMDIYEELRKKYSLNTFPYTNKSEVIKTRVKW